MKPTDEHFPLVLMILDGWGYREHANDNAISMADTPCWDDLWQNAAHTLIETSGEAVGLPAGQMGNSEVGHMNIGAGRVVAQDYTRISQAIADGSFADNAAMLDAVSAANSAGGTVHIMGLMSPGGVHSHDNHFQATVELAVSNGAKRVRVHAFLDGRDTPPRSAGPSLESMQTLLSAHPVADFATVSGRYYAMDRDQRWDRVEKAWDAISGGCSERTASSAEEALSAAYDRGENDEFVFPTVIGEFDGVAPGDAIIFVNFRADRARELTQAFVSDPFDGFERTRPELSAFVTMTEYMKGLPVTLAFPQVQLTRLFGEILSTSGLRQLRIAETEKYAHVTFFFNGGRDQAFAGEDRILSPSPDVATYDLQPQMNAPKLAERLSQEIRSGHWDVIICNVANPDMVGHTGSMSAAIQAVEAVDNCLARVRAAVTEAGGEMLVTADHGNVEQMTDPDSGQMHTAHTTNPVPLVFVGRPASFVTDGSERTGALRDIAPTMLYLLGKAQPAEMSGRSLLRLAGDKRSAA
jgi:2,3-bisphosphoglycerate-independent phosphoglycerate mutase